MRKANLFMIFVLTIAAAFAQASNADCPLKNLKKNQLRGDTSTAYFPGRSSNSNNAVDDLMNGVHRNN